MPRRNQTRNYRAPRASSRPGRNYAMNYNMRSNSTRRPYRRPRYQNRNNSRFWVNRMKPVYDSMGNRIHRQVPKTDTQTQRRMQRDSKLSAARNNATVLPSQQQVNGADGEIYNLSRSDNMNPKSVKRRRGVSKKVEQNNGLAETGLGNFSEAHSDAIQRVRSAATDFSDFLCRSVLWWLAQGWYAAMRKAYIAIGPSSQNDKYFVNLANPFPTHRDACFFLYRMLIVSYNNIRGKGQTLDLKIPRHISFAVAILATKQLQRTPTGVIDMGTQPDMDMTIQTLQTTYKAEMAYINEVVALPAHPFATTGVAETESPISVYHDSQGNAIHSTMKLEEIASIYGYFIPNGNPIDDLPQDVFCYDYNGFDHPSSTQLFRSAFFRIQGTTFSPSLELNPQLLPNQFTDPRLVLLVFSATGFVPTSEHTMYSLVEHLSTSSDRTAAFSDSQGLKYIENKCANSITPIIAPPNPLAFNCALDLAMALQMQITNFMQAANNTTDPTFVFKEANYSWAVSVAQYIEKIPLPSVLFEEMKNFSDCNSWTFVNKPEPTAMYYCYRSIYRTVLGAGAVPAGQMTLNQYYTNVAANMEYMMEIRNLCRMNMAPEINNFMPSVHLVVRDINNRLYSILDAEAFHHKDIAMWLNYSYIPLVSESRPLPLTYIEVKNVDPDFQLSRLYQMCVDGSYQGKSSELDAYYMRLRDKQIGFFGALSSILGAVLPAVPGLISAIFKPKNKAKSDTPDSTTKSTFSTGALVQSMLQSLVNQKDFKQVAVNAPDQQRTVKNSVTKQNLLATRPTAKKLVRQRMMRRLGKAQ